MDRWSDIHTFRYDGMRFDPTTGVASFDYLMQGPTARYPFTDVITFPLPERRPDPRTLAAVDRVLQLLFVAIGVSYYKVMAPHSVELPTVRLAPAARRWALQLYRQGLAQHAYRHNLAHVLDLDLLEQPGPGAGPIDEQDLSGRPPLVAIGGGKDSIVSIEALRAAGLCPSLFAVARTPLLAEVMALAQLPSLTVTRVVDPRGALLLNEHGGYKGHVPVTAQNCLIGVITSLLHGLGPLVLSNERSASAANLLWRGHEVNHQWAKGVAAETMLREAISAHAGITNATFSLLNGMSELHIAELFSRIDGYDTKVTSCNNAYRVVARRSERWCNHCAKCRFVFLALAPFTDRARLVGIFGQDLLDDPGLRAEQRHLEGYRELLGIGGHKPFECVGEITESRVALRLLAENPVWADALVVRALRGELRDWPSDREVAEVFTAQAPRFAPPVYVQALDGLRTAGMSPRASR